MCRARCAGGEGEGMNKIEQTVSMLRRGLGSDTGDNVLAGPHYVDRFAQKVPRKMQQGSGSPSICWICGHQLQRARGKGLGLFYFNLVADKDDIPHRVHGDCTIHAIKDGLKVLAAQAGKGKP